LYTKNILLTFANTLITRIMAEEKKGRVRKNNIEVDDLTKRRLIKVQSVGLINEMAMSTTSEKVRLALAIFDAVHTKLSPEAFEKVTGLKKY